MKKTKKLHWTQTPEGRRRAAKNFKNRTKRHSDKDSPLRTEPVQEYVDQATIQQPAPSPVENTYSTKEDRRVLYEFTIEGRIQERRELEEKLQRVNRLIKHDLIELGLL